MLSLDARTFRSRVARRIFALFVACSLVPVAGFATYSFLRVREQLEADGLVALQREAKSAGSSVFERLLIARAQLLSLDLGPTGDVRRSEIAATSAFLKVGVERLQSLDLGEKVSGRLGSPGRCRLRVRGEAAPA